MPLTVAQNKPTKVMMFQHELSHFMRTISKYLSKVPTINLYVDMNLLKKSYTSLSHQHVFHTNDL